MKTIDRHTAPDPPTPAPPDRPQRSAYVLACRPAAATLLAAALLAGCGGTSGAGIAQISTSTTSTSSTHSSGKPNFLAFARCVRSRGEPSFPDPTSSGQLQLGNVNPNSPVFQAAENACKSLIGGEIAPKPIQTPQAQASVLKMAACMRSHGVPTFPDGPITRSSGIDENSPAFQRAFQTCKKYMTGVGQVPTPGSQIPVTGG